MSHRMTVHASAVNSLCWQIMVLLAELSLIHGLWRIKRVERGPAPTTASVHSCAQMWPLAMTGAALMTQDVMEKRSLQGDAQYLRPRHVIEQIYWRRIGQSCLEGSERENVGDVERVEIRSERDQKRQVLIRFRLALDRPAPSLRGQPILLRVVTLTGELPGSNDRPYEYVVRLVVTLSKRRHQHRRVVYEYGTAQSSPGGFFALAAFPIEIAGDWRRFQAGLGLELCR